MTGDSISVRFQPDDAVEQAFWNLPKPWASRGSEHGQWIIPLELVEILRERLALAGGETARALLSRLPDLSPQVAPA